MSIEQRAPNWIRFYDANEWGRELIHTMRPENLNDPETFVHHTAGNPYRAWTGPMAMRELQRQSHNKGYATVAYDVVVHRDAAGILSIMEGRGAARSAATRDRNEEGEAICMMGYFHPGSGLSARPDDAEIEALAWGIAWMMEKGWSASDSKILGHRDNPRHPGATACPGDYLYDRLWEIKRQVQLITAPTPPPPPPTPEEGDDTMLVGYVKHPNHGAVYRQFSNGTKVWVIDPDELAVHSFIGGPPAVKEMPNDAWMNATGPIVGEIPPGVNRRGIPLS